MSPYIVDNMFLHLEEFMNVTALILWFKIEESTISEKYQAGNETTTASKKLKDIQVTSYKEGVEDGHKHGDKVKFLLEI